MARVEVPIVVLNSSTGLPVNGAAVAISHRANGNPATWYTSETGGTPSTSSAVTDASGRVSAWVDRGAYNLTVTGTGITQYTEPWDAVPGADGTIDTLWLPDGVVTNAKLASGIDAAKITQGTLPPARIADGSMSGAKLASGSVQYDRLAGGIPATYLAGGIGFDKLSRFGELIGLYSGVDETPVEANAGRAYIGLNVNMPKAGSLYAVAYQHGADTRGGTGSVFYGVSVDGVSQTQSMDISSGARKSIIFGGAWGGIAAGSHSVQFTVSLGNSPVRWQPQGGCLLLVFAGT